MVLSTNFFVCPIGCAYKIACLERNFSTSAIGDLGKKSTKTPGFTTCKQ